MCIGLPHCLEIFQSFSNSSINIFLPCIIFISFLVSFFLTPTVLADLSNCDVEQLPLIVFDKPEGTGLLCKVSTESGPNNGNTPGVGLFQGAIRQWQNSRNENDLRMGLFELLYIPSLPAPVAANLLIFIVANVCEFSDF